MAGTMENYRKLASAIVLQAVNDYRSAYKAYLKASEGNKEKFKKIVEVEKELMDNDWFRFLLAQTINEDFTLEEFVEALERQEKEKCSK